MISLKQLRLLLHNLKMIRLLLYIISTLDAFAFVLVITTLNPYVLSLGGGQFFLGLLGSISALINLIWNPIVGSLSDNLGRKRILLHCLFICLIGNILTSLSASLQLLFIARILTTFGTQIGTIVKSLIDDNIEKKDEKMAAFNKIQALGGACFICGSLTSGFLSEYENGYKIIFYTICGLFTINIVLVTVLPNRQQLTTKTLNLKSELKSAFINLTKIDWAKYWDIWLIKFITDFVFTVFHFNLSLILLNQFAITGKLFGYVFASQSILMIILSLSLPKLQKFFYESDTNGFRRLFHGTSMLVLSYLGQSLSPNFPIYYLFLIPVILGRLFFEATFTEMVLSRADVTEKGKILGTFENTFALAGLIAPVISGVISEKWGENTAIFLCTIPLTGAGILTYKKQKTKMT